MALLDYTPQLNGTNAFGRVIRRRLAHAGLEQLLHCSAGARGLVAVVVRSTVDQLAAGSLILMSWAAAAVLFAPLAFSFTRFNNGQACANRSAKALARTSTLY